MIAIVYGGSGSGKSEFAENLTVSLSSGPLYYIATMYPYDKESFAKIDRHRKMRAGKKFETIEAFTGLASLDLEPGSTILLECLSNLVANEMFLEEGAGEKALSSVVEGIRHLGEKAGSLVVVTNNIFDDGSEYEEGTRVYMKVLAEVNRSISGLADVVYEVVHGIVVPIKTPEEET